MINFKNILYPINLDSKNHKNVTEAIEFAKAYKSKLHFLYVNEEDAGYRRPTDFEDAVSLKIKSIVPHELLAQIDVVYAVSKGALGEKVKQYCQNNKIDLIITSHKKRGKLYTSFFDTPDEDILETVRVPVLILSKK